MNSNSNTSTYFNRNGNGKSNAVSRQKRGRNVKKNESRLLGSGECEQQVSYTTTEMESEIILSSGGGGGRELPATVEV